MQNSIPKMLQIPALLRAKNDALFSSNIYDS